MMLGTCAVSQVTPEGKGMALDDFDRSSGGVFDQRVCNGIMADRDGIGVAGAEVASEHSGARGRQPIERPSPSVCSTLPRLTGMDKRLNLLVALAEQSLSVCPK